MNNGAKKAWYTVETTKDKMRNLKNIRVQEEIIRVIKEIC